MSLVVGVLSLGTRWAGSSCCTRIAVGFGKGLKCLFLDQTLPPGCCWVRFLKEKHQEGNKAVPGMDGIPGAGSRPGYSTCDPVPCCCAWGSGGGGPRRPCTHVGDLKEAPGCCLWTCPAVVIMFIWRVKQQLEDLSLCDSVFSYQNKS